MKKQEVDYQKRRPATGFKHVRLLHDNAPAHTSAIVTAFLKKEKVTVLPHPPYSPENTYYGASDDHPQVENYVM